MLAIRFKRIGRKHQPSYRLVVVERRSKRDGKPKEDLGSYNPFTKETTLEKDRIAYWLSVGAQPTDTAHNLLVRNGVIEAPMKSVIMPAKKEEEKKEEPAAPVAEEIKEEAAETPEEEPAEEKEAEAPVEEKKEEEAPQEETPEEEPKEEAPAEEKSEE